jgi:hypothetical protein
MSISTQATNGSRISSTVRVLFKRNTATKAAFGPEGDSELAECVASRRVCGMELGTRTCNVLDQCDVG